MMLEELQRRNYSQATVRAYLLAVRQFAEYFHRPPDQLGPDHIRRFQCHLLQERKLSPRTVVQRVAALRFLFVKTLKRHYMRGAHPLPQVSAPASYRAEPGRSEPAHRFRQQPAAPYDADDALFDRDPSRRTVPPASLRYRQPTQGDAHSGRQGGPRPRRAAHPQTAGDVAGILALDEAEDLPVPGYNKELARGQIGR